MSILHSPANTILIMNYISSPTVGTSIFAGTIASRYDTLAQRPASPTLVERSAYAAEACASAVEPFGRGRKVPALEHGQYVDGARPCSSHVTSYHSERDKVFVPINCTVTHASELCGEFRTVRNGKKENVVVRS